MWEGEVCGRRYNSRLQGAFKASIYLGGRGLGGWERSGRDSKSIRGVWQHLLLSSGGSGGSGIFSPSHSNSISVPYPSGIQNEGGTPSL